MTDREATEALRKNSSDRRLGTPDDGPLRAWWALKYALPKVPQIAAIFWVMKLVSTGAGEVVSDGLAGTSPFLDAFVGIFGMALALYWQLRRRDYRPRNYWFVVMMVAIFGTMVADGLHAVGAPYQVTVPVFAAATGVVFAVWYRFERTLSIHTIDTPRRELFYWTAVLGTFALGTALGDLTASGFGMGYWPSVVLFGVLFLIPGIGWHYFGWNPVLSFWLSYIMTRPLGASVADGLSKTGGGALDLTDGGVAIVAVLVFVALVRHVALTGRDTPTVDADGDHSRSVHHHPDGFTAEHVETALAVELE